MNKINPIFEALSNVDERHIPAAREKTIPRKLRITLIAAALTAALALLAGFTTAAVRGSFTFGFSKENSASHSFELNMTAQEITVPEEYRPQNGTHLFTANVDMPPRGMFEKFGITPPFNDNFTDGEQFIDLRVGILDDLTEVFFRYAMYDKNIDSEVYFTSQYYSRTENVTSTMHQELLPGEPSEVITLNNGSLCMVTKSRAVFSLNGAYCEFELPYEFNVPENYDQLPEDEQRQILAELIKAMPGTETVKQVLADLELL